MTQAGNRIVWLASEEGIRLASFAAAMPDDPLKRMTALRRLTTADRASAIVEHLTLRRRARQRFPRANSMYFTSTGLDQATVPAVARYHAKLLQGAAAVLDAGCGIGSDLGEIAAFCRVLAVDINEEVIACARLNVANNAEHDIRFLVADVMTMSAHHLSRGGIDALFCDPARRQTADGTTHRVRSASLSSPPLTWLLDAARTFPEVLIKLSPAIPDEELLQFGGTAQFVSYGGQCREALALPNRNHAPFAAVQIFDDGSHEELTALVEAHAGTVSQGNWLYEPDPAAIRAHLVDTLGALTNTHRMVDGIAYLLGEELVNNPWLTPYRVIEPVACDVRTLRAWQKRHKRRIGVVKSRGSTPTPEAMLTRLQDRSLDSSDPVVLVLARGREGVTAVLCEPPTL